MALQVRRSDQFDEIAIAGFVLGQEQEVSIDILAAARAFLVEAAAGRDINLASDDRFDPQVAGGLIKIDRAVKNAMIGDRQGGNLQLMRLLHQPVEAAGAIEQRILGVQMEMNKISMRHEATMKVRF